MDKAFFQACGISRNTEHRNIPEHPGTPPRKPGTPPRKPGTPPRKPGTPHNLFVKTCKMLRIPLRIETKKLPGADEEAENSKRLDMLS